MKNKINNIVYVKNIEGNADTTAEILTHNNISYTPKISTIIPVYNAGPYLHACLDSILSQSLKETEIICIDDGSTDVSLKILKEYAAKDNRITVLKQKNLHAGVARNAGIAVANGEYLHFMDADDFLFNDNVYADLYKTAEQTDFCNIIRGKAKALDCQSGEYVHNTRYERDNLPIPSDNVFISAISQPNILIKLAVVPWMGIIRRDFVLQNNLRFNNQRCCNDRSFFMTSAAMADIIFLADICMVNHRVNNSASLRGIRDRFFDCHFQSIQVTRDFMLKHHIEENAAKTIISEELWDMSIFFKQYFFTSPYSRKIYNGTIKFLQNFNLKEYTPYLAKYSNYRLLCSLARRKKFAWYYYFKDKKELADRNNWVDELGHKEHPTVERTCYKIFGLPIITICKKLNGDQKRYYFLGLPILKSGIKVIEQ